MRNNVWIEAGKSSLSTVKDSVTRPYRISPSKISHNHSYSMDLDSAITSKFNSTFTTGFSSSGFSTGMSKTTSKDSDQVGGVLKREYNKGYQKFKLNSTIPVYDFTGGDSPWLNNSKVNNKINGREQNFKINHTIYDKVYDSARPVAHTKGRKFCSMTRFMKSLEDNRINQRWRMTTYRGSHR